MVLDLVGTWLGLGLGGVGTKGLGTGLDNWRRVRMIEETDLILGMTTIGGGGGQMIFLGHPASALGV